MRAMDIKREPRKCGSWICSPTGLLLLVLLGVAAYYLLTEHRAHILGLLPLLFLLLCPLIHILFHRGHESNHAKHIPDEGQNTDEEQR